MKTLTAVFSYYQGKHKYTFDKDFTGHEHEIMKDIKDFVQSQNAGEPPSDRIKFVKVKRQQPPLALNKTV